MFNKISIYNPYTTFQFQTFKQHLNQLNNQWSMIESRSSSTTSPSSIATTATVENLDDHCDRHLDNIIANLTNRFDDDEEEEQTNKNTNTNDFKSDDEEDPDSNDQVTIFQEGEENVENSIHFVTLNPTTTKTSNQSINSSLDSNNVCIISLLKFNINLQ